MFFYLFFSAMSRSTAGSMAPHMSGSRCRCQIQIRAECARKVRELILILINHIHHNLKNNDKVFSKENPKMLRILLMFIVIIILLPSAQIHIFRIHAFARIFIFSYRAKQLAAMLTRTRSPMERMSRWILTLSKTWCLHENILDRYPPNIKWPFET